MAHMKVERATNALGRSVAVFSDDLVYRYVLRREWGEPDRAHHDVLTWIMLNPSTADAERNDPTLTRCQSFSRAWGWPGFAVVNLYALRSTDPRALRGHPDPVGPANRTFLHRAALGPAVVAWGTHGGAWAREWASGMFPLRGFVPLCLGITKDGSPLHPLYVPGATQPRAWQGYA